MLESLFREEGCEGAELTTLKVPHSTEPDLICTLPAADAEAGTIIVGGHYDHVQVGMGAVDDWSGAVLLPSLYAALKSEPRRHRYVFIAFAGEENGLNGSTEYVRRLTKPERAEVKAMINLECLGLTPPKVWVTRADRRLLSLFTGVAKAIGVPVAGSNVDDLGDDDSHPFLSANIPVLTMHSITQETFEVLHSPYDQVKAIQPNYYYAAYRMAAAFLSTLDTALETPRATK